MKLLFYLFLPMVVLEKYGFYIFGVLVVLFFIPGDWWKKSPAARPNTLIGKLLPFLNISLRNVALRIFAILLVFLFLPFVLFIPIIAAVMLPFVAIAKMFGRNPEKEEVSIPGLALLAIAFGLLAVGLMVPINVIPVVLYFLMGKPAGNAIEALAAGRDAVRDDIFIGVTGIAIVALLLFLDAFWRLRQARQVENLPTSKIGSAAIGLVEIKGTARKIGYGDDTILQMKMDMFSYFEPRQKLEEFYVEDDTGKILVDPRKCRIRVGWITDLLSIFTGFHEIVLKRRIARDDVTDAVTRTLMHGDRVYVIGNAEIKPGMKGTGSESLVIKPAERSRWNPSFWRFLFGSDPMPSSRNFSNVFFISDSHEMAAKKSILRGFKTVWLISFVWLLASAFLIWSSYWPERQTQNPEGWRNAYWRGPEPNPSRAIMDYTRNQRLFRFEKYMKELPPRDRTAVPALMEALSYEDSRFSMPATVELYSMVPQIKDRHAEMVTLLRRNLQTEDAHHLQMTIVTLSMLGPSATPAVPDLMKQLKCSSTNTYEVSPNIIRFQAASALGYIGPSAARAIPALQVALNDPSPDVREAARQALAKIRQ